MRRRRKWCGWVTQTTFPSTLIESYNYDLVGNLQSKTDRKNQTIQYVYDALYRLSSKTYPDQTSVEYAYDLAGKVQQVSDPTGTYGFAYDNMGRLIGTSTQYSYLPGFNFQNAYTYDAASNRKSLTAPDGSISTYGYDTLNRLNGLANSWAGSFGFSYDALSRRTQLTRPNGITTNYNYDSLSHLLSVLHQAGTNTLDGASYTYDPAGNRTSKSNYLNGVTSNYTYDPLYELTQVTQGGSTTETYSYDAVGNRLSSSGVPTYNYNSSNELTSNSSGSYSYDNNGNMLTDASGKSYTWDFENQMVSAVVPGTNGGTTTFKYDPFGRRIQKSGPLGTTNYLYDGMVAKSNIVEEVDSSGNILVRYTHGLAFDEPLAESNGSTTSFYEADGLGSISSLSSSSAALADSYVFDSYGRATATTGTLGNSFQFTGREFDPEVGIYYYRARYYDPAIGRFISQDRAWFKDGPNLFAYVRNNPTDFFDPTGLAKLCCRPANVRGTHTIARLRGVGDPCHCFVRLSDGTTLGGYFKYGLLMPQRNNSSDTNTTQANCSDMPGKPCESDRKAQTNYDAESWGIYGLSGTSNAVAVDISGGIKLPSCAWGQTPPSLPSLPSPPDPPWPLWPGFPDGGLPH